MTPEQIRAIQEATTLDELDALLQSYLDAGIITRPEAAQLAHEYGALIEDAEDAASAQEVTEKTGITVPPGVIARIRPDVETQSGTYQAYMADPGIMGYLNQYTSRNDLATRLGTLIREGYLPDERIAGQIFRAMLNEQPDAKYATALEKAQTELAFEQSLAGTEDASPEAEAKAQAAVDKAQRDYDAALADIDTSSQRLIRAGMGRLAKAEAEAQADIEDYNARLAAASYQREATKYDRYDRQRAFNDALAQAYRTPGVTEADFQNINLTPEAMEVYLSSNEATQMIIDRLSGVAQKAQDRQAAKKIEAEQKQRGVRQFADNQAFQQYKTAAETDLTERLLTEFYEGRKKKENYLPGYGYVEPIKVEPIKLEMPDAGRVAEEFLKGKSAELGYGQGTNLRDFILGEIPGIYEKALPERERWLEEQNAERQMWADKQNTTLDKYYSYSERQKQLQEAALSWGELVVKSPPALRDYAERMYYKTLKEMEVMKQSDYPERPSRGVASPRQEIWNELMGTLPSELTGDAAKMTGLYARAIKLRESQGKTMEIPGRTLEGEDPFKTALKKKNFLADYYRRPGAGLVTRLTPSVRF